MAAVENIFKTCQAGGTTSCNNSKASSLPCAVFDVTVDIRKSSPTFGQQVGCELSEDNKRQFSVLPGFAHGFVVLAETADFLYKTTD